MMCIICGASDHGGICSECEDELEVRLDAIANDIGGDKIYYCIVTFEDTTDYIFRIDEDEVPHVISFRSLDTYCDMLLNLTDEDSIHFYNGITMILCLTQPLTKRQARLLKTVQAQYGPLVLVSNMSTPNCITIDTNVKQYLLEFVRAFEGTSTTVNELMVCKYPDEIEEATDS